MAQTFASRQLRHLRAYEARFTSEQRELAMAVSRIVTRYSVLPDLTVPNTRERRAALRRDVWELALRPYYLGTGDDPFVDGRPQSPYARLIYDGIEGATRIAVQQQIALVRRVVRDDVVWRWLTGDRGFVLEYGAYDPYHTWVDPNGYTLSDRVWRAAGDARVKIDRLLDYHISQGTSAVKMAELLEGFLTESAASTRTRTPYGRSGSYAARRLARTEITAAAGRATVNASIANPFVTGIQWRLSQSHKCCDVCDDYAKGGENSDGVYPPERVPTYPPHPHCMCSLLPVTGTNAADLVADLRANINAARTGLLARLQGLLNESWLVQAIMNGVIGQVIERILR